MKIISTKHYDSLVQKIKELENNNSNLKIKLDLAERKLNFLLNQQPVFKKGEKIFLENEETPVAEIKKIDIVYNIEFYKELILHLKCIPLKQPQKVQFPNYYSFEYEVLILTKEPSTIRIKEPHLQNVINHFKK